MAKAKRSGASIKAYYGRYKNSGIHDINARKRLDRALKRNPENEQIVTALKNIMRTRKTPLVPVWNPTKRRIAMLYKLFTGKVNVDMFSKNEKVSAPALLSPGPLSLDRTKPTKANFEMFTIKSRVVWN